MKSLRYTHVMVWLTLLSIHSLAPGWSQEASQPHPNILLLLADDQSFDTIG
ncbi:MAG: hypothetical protein IT422_03520 [Pirellulaceae bacterium]|nr:hypothetical protein [Pirellulaceae bacterium]